MEAVITAATGSKDSKEVAVMADQATQVGEAVKKYLPPPRAAPDGFRCFSSISTELSEQEKNSLEK